MHWPKTNNKEKRILPKLWWSLFQIGEITPSVTKNCDYDKLTRFFDNKNLINTYCDFEASCETYEILTKPRSTNNLNWLNQWSWMFII